MDFVVEWSSFHGNTVIMIVVDCFSKVHLDMVPTHLTVYNAAERFTTILYRYHLYSKNIISDPDFLGNFWGILFKYHGMKLQMSIAYQQQIDGQKKVLIRACSTYVLLYMKNLWHGENSLYGQNGITIWRFIALLAFHHSKFLYSPLTIPHYILGSSYLEATDNQCRHAIKYDHFED